MITNSVLTAVGVNPKNALLYQKFLAEYAPEFDVVGPIREAHFLAQILHESMMLSTAKEIWGPTPAQLSYERDFSKPWDSRQLAFRLGNSERGDGKKFMGHGLIQVTGRYNHMIASQEIGVDFVTNPEFLMQPQYAGRSAYQYWKRKNINSVATLSPGAVTMVTKKINPGLNGLQERIDLWSKCYAQLIKEGMH